MARSYRMTLNPLIAPSGPFTCLLERAGQRGAKPAPAPPFPGSAPYAVRSNP